MRSAEIFRRGPGPDMQPDRLLEKKGKQLLAQGVNPLEQVGSPPVVPKPFDTRIVTGRYYGSDTPVESILVRRGEKNKPTVQEIRNKLEHIEKEKKPEEAKLIKFKISWGYRLKTAVRRVAREAKYLTGDVFDGVKIDYFTPPKLKSIVRGTAMAGRLAMAATPAIVGLMIASCNNNKPLEKNLEELGKQGPLFGGGLWYERDQIADDAKKGLNDYIFGTPTPRSIPPKEEYVKDVCQYNRVTIPADYAKLKGEAKKTADAEIAEQRAILAKCIKVEGEHYDNLVRPATPQNKANPTTSTPKPARAATPSAGR